MRNRTKRLIFLLALCAAAVSCRSNARVEAELLCAEQCLYAAPDSALCILSRIDPDNISRRRTRAEYVLLYTMAQDKNYILAENDSLIRIARNYYRRRPKELRRHFLSEYYYSQILHNRGEDSRALVHFLRIEDEGRRLGDPYLLGLLYQRICEIYETQYNYATTLEYARLAYENFKQAGKNYHCGYALSDIGSAHFDMKQYDSAYTYYSQSLRLVESERDTAMMQFTLGDLAYTRIAQDMPDEACALLWQIRHRLHRNWSDRERVIITLAHLSAGRLDSACYYLQLAEAVIESDSPTRGFLKDAAAEVHFKIHDYRKAAEEYRDGLILQDSLDRGVLQFTIRDEDKKIVVIFPQGEEVDYRTGREVVRWDKQWFSGNFTLGFGSNLAGGGFHYKKVSFSPSKDVSIIRGRVYGAVKYNDQWRACVIETN
ncbi:hypothetical protein [uncultured Alistipes sp.]|nr:hypothetical protein [uncultured Alistipes sp.]